MGNLAPTTWGRARATASPAATPRTFVRRLKVNGARGRRTTWSPRSTSFLAGVTSSDEQHDEREVDRQGLDRALEAVLAHDLGDEGGPDADPDSADVGERQAGERTDGGRPESEEHQQREKPGVERHRRRQQHPRSGGETRADQPGETPDGRRAR